LCNIYNHFPEDSAVTFYIRGVVSVARQMKKIHLYKITQKPFIIILSAYNFPKIAFGRLSETNICSRVTSRVTPLGTLRYATARCYYGYFGREGLG